MRVVITDYQYDNVDAERRLVEGGVLNCWITR